MAGGGQILSRCPFNTKIITKASACRAPRARRKSKNPSASWRANSIPTWRRTRKRPRKNSRRSTRPTKFCPTRTSAKNTTSWAPTGNPARSSARRPAIGGFGAGQGFRGGRAAGGEEFHFGGTGFSDFFEQTVRRADARRGRRVWRGAEIFRRRILPNAARTSRATSWSRSKRPRAAPCARSTFVTATVPNRIRSKFRPASAKARSCASPAAASTAAAAARRGDLYLRVRFAKHPDFDVDGQNLIYELELAPWEAALGAEISVPTLDGKVSIKIPAGTPSGQKLRVRNRGLKQRDGAHGDLMVVTKIVVPGKPSTGEKKLWEQLARESKFNPRV